MAKAKKAVTKKTTKNPSKTSAPARQNGATARSATPTDERRAVTVDRRTGDGRRSGEDRRKASVPVAVERRKLERRAKVSRRRQIDPTTCERDYSVEEIEFMNALDAYKRSSGRMFPTCSEILEVIRNLGYQKAAMETQSIPPSGGIEVPVAEPAGNLG